MTIDDIYFAAIEGDKARLSALLKENAETKGVDLNMMLDGGVNNGVHSSFTVLFSILVQMKDRGFNKEIMDLLVLYGIDLDTKVVVSTDAWTRRIPILVYALRDWNAPEMVTYFMERGADPNNYQEEQYGTRKERYPLTYFANVFRDDCLSLIDLLSHGAYADAVVFTYNQEERLQQMFPVLFYALRNSDNYDKAVWMFKYGANYLQKTVNTGLKWGEMTLEKYLTIAYPQLKRKMEEAYSRAAGYQEKPRYVSREDFLIEDQEKKVALKQDEKVVKQAETKKSNPAEELAKALREEYTYHNAIKEEYYDAIYASKKKPGLFGSGKKEIQAAKEKVEQIESKMNKLRAAVGEWHKKNGNKPEISWNKKRYLWEEDFYPTDQEVLIWSPFKKIAELPNGLGVRSTCIIDEEEVISAENLQKLIEKGTLSPIYIRNVHPEESYYVAELCMWSVENATEVKTHYESAYTENEIRGLMKERKQELDDRERGWNAIMHGKYRTNEERYYLRDLDGWDYYLSEEHRAVNLNKYQDKLRSQRVAVHEIDKAYQFNHIYRKIGVVLFDKMRKTSAVYLYNSLRNRELFLLDRNKAVYDMDILKPIGDLKEIREVAIKALCTLDLEPIDLMAEKPDYLTSEEWHIFNSTCCYLPGKELRDKMIRKQYSRAAWKKDDQYNRIR